MKFSERLGYSTRKALQIEGIDDDTRNQIWQSSLDYVFDENGVRGEYEVSLRIKNIFSIFFKMTTDQLPHYNFEKVRIIRKLYFNLEWFQCFDFIEFCLNLYQKNSITYKDFSMRLNWIFEQEKSAYRYIDDKIVPISDEIEISSIRDILSKAEKFQNTRKHIQAAISLFSQKPNPDYRNAMKEAISAVEATVGTIVGDDKKKFGEAVKQICNEKNIHPSLREGLLKIYGYTSDGDGIRHALTEEPTLTHADAKFMLVSCSAFCNFLIEKTELE